jgi:predicted metal-dependent phosphotriesterase family hydrolase
MGTDMSIIHGAGVKYLVHRTKREDRPYSHISEVMKRAYNEIIRESDSKEGSVTEYTGSTEQAFSESLVISAAINQE